MFSLDRALRKLEASLPEDWQARSNVVRLSATLQWHQAVSAVETKDYATAETHYRNAVSQFDRLLKSDGDDSRLDRSRNLSIALKNLGAVQWELGARTSALASYRRALTLDEDRLKTRPDDPTWLLDLSFSVASLAYCALATGEVASAVSQYQRALDLRRKALTLDPQNRQARGAVERGYRSLAGALDSAGETRQAREARAAADAMAAAAKAPPGASNTP